MKNNYSTPMIEVLEIEIEDAILQESDTTTSLLESFGEGGSLGSN
ncbi:MAG: hypothetical protein SNI45_02675 [Rikenellaceae bacterium]